MHRREFIRNAAIAAGAAALAPSDLIQAGSRRIGGSPAIADAATAEQASSGQTAPSEATAEQASSSQAARRRLRKSIMWGTVGYSGSVLEICKAIKSAGFDGIEPNSHMDRAEVLDAMARTGLCASSVCNVKHWELLLSSPEASVRKKGIEAQIHAMQDAKAYGTDAVLLVPGRVDADTSYQDCWDRSTACIRELIPVAKDLKVHICLENVWNNFLLGPIEARNFIDQFESEWVCAYFDCGNILKTGWPEQWIQILGSRIKRVHIKEFSTTIENSQGRGAGFGVKLTDGEVNWRAVTSELKKCYTGGWLTTEQGNSQTQEDLNDLSARLDKIVNL